jgi:outer membrane biogenesis lipoprotein LolB
MRTFLLASAMLLLAACGTTYTHPTKSLQEFDRDKVLCEQEAKKALAKKGQANDSCAVLEETKRCLETKKGWVQK